MNGGSALRIVGERGVSLSGETLERNHFIGTYCLILMDLIETNNRLWEPKFLIEANYNGQYVVFNIIDKDGKAKFNMMAASDTADLSLLCERVARQVIQTIFEIGLSYEKPN